MTCEPMLLEPPSPWTTDILDNVVFFVCDGGWFLDMYLLFCILCVVQLICVFHGLILVLDFCCRAPVAHGYGLWGSSVYLPILYIEFPSLPVSGTQQEVRIHFSRVRGNLLLDSCYPNRCPYWKITLMTQKSRNSPAVKKNNPSSYYPKYLKKNLLYIYFKACKADSTVCYITVIHL